MSIKNFQINFPGQLSNPRLGHLLTTDILSKVTSAGYLNPYMLSQGFSILPTDVIMVVAADGSQFYKPVFSGTIVTLTALP